MRKVQYNNYYIHDIYCRPYLYDCVLGCVLDLVFLLVFMLLLKYTKILYQNIIKLI